MYKFDILLPNYSYMVVSYDREIKIMQRSWNSL